MRRLKERACYLAAALCAVFAITAAPGCNGGGWIISDDPAVAREQLAQRQELADQAQQAIAEADAIVTGLHDQITNLDRLRQEDAGQLDTLRAQLAAALSDDHADAAQVEQLEELVAEAEQAGADTAITTTIDTLSEKLEWWTDQREHLKTMATAYSEDVARQQAALESGTGGTGLGTTLQLAGGNVERAAAYAPPPARGYMELGGWALGAIGTLLVGVQQRRVSEASAKRDQEARMLDAAIASMEAAKQIGDGTKIDFFDLPTKRAIDAIQNATPGLKERVDRVTSKVA